MPAIQRQKPAPPEAAAAETEPTAAPEVSKQNALATEIVAGITKAHGDGVAQTLGASAFKIAIRGICPSGVATIDRAIGRGGFPFGRICMLSGNEGSGKTTLALHLAAECQAMGGIVIYQDMEYKLDPDLARSIGVNLEDLIISQPPHLEACLQVLETTIEMVSKWRTESGQAIPILAILDSLNAAGSKAEMEGEFDDQHMGAQARVMSLGLRKLAGMCAHEMVCFLMISQLREKIGVMYGAKYDTACGKAPRFYSSVIAELKRTGTIKKGETPIGSEVEINFAKNQIAPPFSKGTFQIIFGKGIDKDRALIEQAITDGMVVSSKSGWLEYGGEKVQGANRFVENAKLMDQLRREMYERPVITP